MCPFPVVSLGYNYENAAETEDLNNKRLLTDQEIHVFCRRARKPKLAKQAFFMSKKSERSLNERPPAALNNYFCHLILEIRKTQGEEREPNFLTISETLFSGINNSNINTLIAPH